MTRQEYQRHWREDNKEKVKEYQKEYQQKNRERIKEQVSKYGKKRYQENREKKDAQNKEWGENPDNRKKRAGYVKKYEDNNKEKVAKHNSEYGKSLAGYYRRYKYRANRAGYELTITLEDFKEITDNPCTYCGGDEQQRGVDRVDNTIGYIKSNCVSCCGICNMMKMKLSVKEFLDHIKKIYKHQI